MLETRIPTSRPDLTDVLRDYTGSRVVLEASTPSEWGARHPEFIGMEVIVADPNFAPMYATRSKKVKTDKRDARCLAQAARLGAYKVRILLASGFANQPLFLELYSAGRLLERSIYPASQIIELPIRKEHRGGLDIVAWTVRDHQNFSQQASIDVPWDDKELKLELTSLRDSGWSGTTEKLRVAVRDSSGKPVGKGVAEVYAYMYDHSLDLLFSHVSPRPLALFPRAANLPQILPSFGTTQVKRLTDALGFFGPGTPRSLDPVSPSFYLNYMKSISTPPVPFQYFSDERAREVCLLILPSEPKLHSQPEKAEKQAGRRSIALAEDSLEDWQHRDSLSNKDGEPQSKNAPATSARTNAAETAFFLPSLPTDEDGAVTLEFQVPASNTSWTLWIHAVTETLRSGSLRKLWRSHNAPSP